MTVRDTLLREHRFLDRLLERLEAALRLEERAARAESRNFLILLSPCLEAHVDVERLVFRPGHGPVRGPATDPSLRLRNLQADLRGLLESGQDQPLDRYRAAVVQLIERVRSRFQAEGSWEPRHRARPVDVVKRVTTRVQTLEREVHERAAALEQVTRSS